MGRIAAQRTHSRDHVVVVGERRQARELAHVELAIGIGEEEPLASGDRKAVAQRSPVTAARRVPDQA